MTQMESPIQRIIQLLNLEPLPGEGGLYRQTYRSSEGFPAGALSERYQGEEKPICTAIYYMLTDSKDSFSALHRLPTDEIWHFYLGDPLEMTLLHPDGSSEQIILGQDIFTGQQLQFTVPRGTWQGTRLVRGGEFGLAGTTMAPGYTLSDNQIGVRAALLEQYPAERERILVLTR